MNDFKNWLSQYELKESWRDFALAGMMAAGVAGPGYGANSPMPINSSIQNKTTLIPQPKIKNATAIQIWGYQVRFVQEEERKIRVGKRPSIDYILLYKKYGGKMPEPPVE